MYKSLSEAMQARQRRNIALSHENTGGVDETVWAKTHKPINDGALDDAQDERVRLLEIKLELENKIRKTSNAIGWAERGLYRNGQRSLDYHRLCDERDQLEKERSSYYDRLNELQIKLTAIKVKIKKQADEKEQAKQQAQREAKLTAVAPDHTAETLGEVFMEMAKEMLADPVYQRVLIAAIHRLRDRKGQ